MNSKIDYTYLKPFLNEGILYQIIDASLNKGYRGICVFPEMAEMITDVQANRLLSAGQKISVVVGFPFGVEDVERKLRSVPWFVTDIDAVINITNTYVGQEHWMEQELLLLRYYYAEHTLKIIIESELLHEDAIVRVCKSCNSAGVDYIKSCSGFNGKISDEKAMLMLEHKGNCLTKMSGGIGTIERASRLISLGADVIGSSAELDFNIER